VGKRELKIPLQVRGAKKIASRMDFGKNIIQHLRSKSEAFQSTSVTSYVLGNVWRFQKSTKSSKKEESEKKLSLVREFTHVHEFKDVQSLKPQD
jgi:hypothetical protein